ncbi:MAG: DCC1-like thiol-disulfide oxidoreductase family protein [Pseudomonadota bacterium]
MKRAEQGSSDGLAVPVLAGTSAIVYDGACPFCSRYAALLRLRDAVGPVDLIDARRGGELVDFLWSSGLDLDKGMAFIYDGQIFYGAAATERLALLSTRSDLFNRFNGSLLRHRWIAEGLYPALRLSRRAALILRGQGPLRGD